VEFLVGPKSCHKRFTLYPVKGFQPHAAKLEPGWHGGDIALTRDGWQVTSDGLRKGYILKAKG